MSGSLIVPWFQTEIGFMKGSNIIDSKPPIQAKIGFLGKTY